MQLRNILLPTASQERIAFVQDKIEEIEKILEEEDKKRKLMNS